MSDLGNCIINLKKDDNLFQIYATFYAYWFYSPKVKY